MNSLHVPRETSEERTDVVFQRKMTCYQRGVSLASDFGVNQISFVRMKALILVGLA